MKKVMSLLLVIALCLSMGTIAFADEAVVVKSFEEVKQHVSEVYGLPIDVVDKLDPQKVWDMEVDDEQIVSTEEVYIQYVVDEKGNATATKTTKAAYQAYISTPQLAANPVTETTSWMRIYLTIINNGSTYDLATTYTWLTTPAFLFNEHNILSTVWDYGNYITADGFYSYDSHASQSGIEYFNENDFVQPYGNPRSVNYVHVMEDIASRYGHVFHTNVTISRDYSASYNRAMSTYTRERNRTMIWDLVVNATFFMYLRSPGNPYLAFTNEILQIMDDAPSHFMTFGATADIRVD